MAFVVFSVDTERDSSHAITGNPLEAATFGFDKPSFTASENGLKALLPLLEEMKIPATFFFEGTTAEVLNGRIDLRRLFARHEIGFHGLNHEDFAGIKTGVKIERAKREEIFKDGLGILKKAFGVEKPGFRAPYLSIDLELVELAKKHCAYDSSLYGDRISFDNGFPRIAIYQDLDEQGKQRKGFLWPLIEGERNEDEYITQVRKAVERKVDPIVIGTHSWHTHATRKDGFLGERQAEKQLAKVKRVLEGIKEINGVEFATIKRVLELRHFEK